MPPKLQHIRSDLAEKRPDPALLEPGQAAQNRAIESPGMFFSDAAGGLVKVGPTYVGPTAPNATPAGFAGNSKGEQWCDTSGPKPVLKTWDGVQWLASGGGSSVSTGDIAPVNPVNGDLWFRTDRAELFVWYDDGDSGQWVEATTGGGGGGGGTAAEPIVAGEGLTGGTITDTGTVALDTVFTDARYVNVTGDTMSGPLVVPNAATGGQAINSDTADGRYVNVTGDTMTGPLVVPNATLGTQALNMNTADARYVNVTGDTMTGDLNMNSASIIATTNGGVNAGAYSVLSPDGGIKLNRNNVSLGPYLDFYINNAFKYRLLSLSDSLSFYSVGTNPGDIAAAIGQYGSLWLDTSTARPDLAANRGAIFARSLQGRPGVNGTGWNNGVNLSWTGAGMQLWVDATNLGTINTTSDYRIKEAVQPQPEAWERIKQLRPVTYQLKDFHPTSEDSAERSLFRADSLTRDGFIAHEVAEVIPSGVDGVKDDPEQVQSLRVDAILSVTVKALQEALAKIETLEARITTLEAV